MNWASIPFIFLTGLTAGGLTCLALQGSLLASTFAKQKNFYKPTFIFLIAKLVSHTVLGFLLGLLGTSLNLSPTAKGLFQITLSIYLLGIAGNLLEIHPLFRHFALTPPKFIVKLLKKHSLQENFFTPAILGSLTVFVPCATTQAIEIIALGTSNPILSSVIMFSFILGTFPSFIIFGFLIQNGSHAFQKHFPTIGGLALLIMSLFTFNNGLALTGSIYTAQNFWHVATNQTNDSEKSILGANTQTAIINVSNSGYTPQNITLHKGVPTKLELVTNKVSNCSRSFTIPSLKIERVLPEDGKTTIEFTPEKEGLLAFSCSMGMYTGQFNIIN